MKNTLARSLISAIVLAIGVLYQCGDLETDVTPPTVPTGVTARPSDNLYGINVSWAASTDDNNVAGYNVYRDGALRDMSLGTAYLDTMVSSGITYCYRVAAYDRAGNMSEQSAEACIAFTD